MQEWNRALVYISSHRRTICEIVEDRIWLRGTTLEEIEKTQNETLNLALAEANQGFADYLVKASAEGERFRAEQAAHEHRVREAAKNIEFE